MKILAVDTATNSCSVAVTDQASLLAESTQVSVETHSKHLLGMIGQTLALAGITVHDLDGLAVTRGPGSFTGLRIGLSAVKGMAVATRKPVVGISTLRALASQFPSVSLRICAMIDARKSEVYAGAYRFMTTPQGDRELVCDMQEQVVPPDSALDAIQESCLFVGTGAAAYQAKIEDYMKKRKLRACFVPPAMNFVRASTVAYLSRYYFQNHQVDDVETLKPHYLRPSDAEIKASKNAFIK